MRTWKVLEWNDAPKEPKDWVPLDCECGYEACCPASIDAPIITAFGMRLVFDPPNFKPPSNYLPDTIKCRKCGRIYTSDEES